MGRIVTRCVLGESIGKKMVWRMVQMKAWEKQSSCWGEGHVREQSPSGSECQDEKKRLDLSSNEELLELLELRSDG